MERADLSRCLERVCRVSGEDEVGAALREMRGALRRKGGSHGLDTVCVKLVEVKSLGAERGE